MAKIKKNLINIIFFIFINIISFSMEIKNGYIEDNYGNKIKMKEYKRVVITDPSCIEIFYLLGGEKKIVGVAKTKLNKMWPSEKIEKLKSVGTVAKPSVENIVALMPDLVILNLMSTKIEGFLKEQNIPYLIDRSTNFEEIFNKTIIYGKLIGKEKEALILVNEKKSKLLEIEKLSQKNLKLKKGIIFYSSNPLIAFSEDTIPGEILKIFKIKNLSKGLVGKKHIVSQEYLIKENPDLILGTMKINSLENILNGNEVVKYTDAYKNKKIYIFESEKILRSSPRIVDSLEEIYEVLIDDEK